MQWSTDTKTGYDDLEVYMEYGYVFVSSTGRNNVEMAAFSFKVFPIQQIRNCVFVYVDDWCINLFHTKTLKFTGCSIGDAFDVLCIVRYFKAGNNK